MKAEGRSARPEQWELRGWSAKHRAMRSSEVTRTIPNNAQPKGGPRDPRSTEPRNDPRDLDNAQSRSDPQNPNSAEPKRTRNTPAVRSREVIRETPAVRTEGINGTQLVRTLGRSPVELPAPVRLPRVFHQPRVFQPRFVSPRPVSSGLPAPDALNHVPGALNHVGFDCPDHPTPQGTERTGRRGQSP